MIVISSVLLLIACFSMKLCKSFRIGSTAVINKYHISNYHFKSLDLFTPYNHGYRMHIILRLSSSLSSTSGKGFSDDKSLDPSNSISTIIETTTSKKPEEWNLKGLKAETSRMYLRFFKKVGKASERLSKGLEIYHSIKDSSNLEELEKCPNIDELKDELIKLQATLNSIGRLEEGLKNIRSNKDSNYVKLIEDAITLNINDSPPPKQDRGEPKPKGKPSPPRKPYFIYNSSDNVSIRVGRAAPDNDELSCNPEHRDNDDWWLHVAGYAGSHVVIRYTNDDIYEKYKETVLDAAMLAAVNSKAPQSGKIPVSLTRCRFVTKPSGAKAGMVRLNGDVMTIKIDVKANQARLDRLNLTKE